jgi:carbon-monoxide dehydrogenase small subunit
MSERQRRTIRFTLNGRQVVADIHVSETLVEMLHREFGLTGARESCGQGMCGCCTALVNGTAVSGCLYLAAFAEDAEVLTVEGLASREVLHPIQQAFIAHSALQCGYCTPGFELMTKTLLERHPHPTDQQIREYLSGNLCRCGTYPEIIEAVKAVADRSQEGQTNP